MVDPGDVASCTERFFEVFEGDGIAICFAIFLVFEIEPKNEIL